MLRRSRNTHDQDREADRRLRRGHRQDEKHEDLAADIAQEARERDEVEVHREQHQLDAHEQDDDVLAVQEHAGDRDGEQDAGQGEHVGEGDHGAFLGGHLDDPHAILGPHRDLRGDVLRLARRGGGAASG